MLKYYNVPGSEVLTGFAGGETGKLIGRAKQRKYLSSIIKSVEFQQVTHLKLKSC